MVVMMVAADGTVVGGGDNGGSGGDDGMLLSLKVWLLGDCLRRRRGLERKEETVGLWGIDINRIHCIYV